jgi:hypothetical protein
MLKARIHFRGGQGVATARPYNSARLLWPSGHRKARPSPHAEPAAQSYRGKQASRSELS